MKTLDDLPTRVGLFELVSEWAGVKKYVGKNWLIRCTDCKTERVTSTSIWNAAHKGNYKMLCKCQRKDGIERTGRKANKYLHFNGVSGTVQEWADRTGISASSIYARMSRRKAQHPSHAAPDEWVIFGEDPDRVKRFTYIPTEAEQESAQVASLLISLQNDILRMLRPVVADALLTHIKPVLLRAHASKPLVLPAKDPDYARDGATYDPSPHPLDDEPFCKDANYRKAREYWGDNSVANLWESMKQYPATRTYHLEQVYIEPPQSVTVTESGTVPDSGSPKKPYIQASVAPDPDRIYCIPEHQNAMWNESMGSVLRSPGLPAQSGSTPIDIPEEFAKQEDTSPLTPEDVDHYLNTPWWQARQARWRLHQHNFGFICRTQYERIKAYLQPPKKDYPGPADHAIAFAKGYQWTTDHHLLNEFLDFCAIRDWYEEHRNTRGYFENAEARELLSGRYEAWLESDDPNLQKQALRLPEWFPFLKDGENDDVALPESATVTDFVTLDQLHTELESV